MSDGTDSTATAQAGELEELFAGVDTAEAPPELETEAGPEVESAAGPTALGEPFGSAHRALDAAAEAHDELEKTGQAIADLVDHVEAEIEAEEKGDPEPEPPLQLPPAPTPELPSMTAEEHFAAAQAEIVKRRAAGPTLATLALDGRKLTRLRLLVDSHIAATIERHGRDGNGVSAIRSVDWLIELHDDIEKALEQIPRDELPPQQEPMPRQENGDRS